MNSEILMRIMVMFDLPVGSKKERKEDAKFRSSLLKCGFFMLQFSVYARIVRGYDKAEVITNKIKSKLPSKGNVRMITITEKQYANMVVLKGKPKNSTEKLSLETPRRPAYIHIFHNNLTQFITIFTFYTDF